MSELRKSVIGRLATRTLGGPGGRALENYAPVKWDRYFDSEEDLDTSRGKFHIYKKGAGKPAMICLHGGGYNGLTWGVFGTALTNLLDCEVIAIDLRGHGNTHTDDDADVSLQTLASDIVEIIGLLFPDDEHPIVLIGHSLGGAVAVECSYQLTQTVMLCVLDVVEGTAVNSLPAMQRVLRNRPTSFASIQHAIQWCCHSTQYTNNVEAAKVSMPGQIVNAKTGNLAANECDRVPLLDARELGGYPAIRRVPPVPPPIPEEAPQAAGRSAAAGSSRAPAAGPSAAAASPRAPAGGPSAPAASPRAPAGSRRASGASSRASVAGPRASFASPRAAVADPGASGASPRAAVADPGASGASPRTSAASPRAPTASSRAPTASSRAPTASPRASTASPRATTASPRTTDADAGAAAADAGATVADTGATAADAGAAPADAGAAPADAGAAPADSGAAAEDARTAAADTGAAAADAGAAAADAGAAAADAGAAAADGGAAAADAGAAAADAGAAAADLSGASQPSTSKEEDAKKGAVKLMRASSCSEYLWRIDLSRTEPFWEGWFRGLSQKFMDAPPLKMLLLANIYGLDTTLIVGQMQGKFYFRVFGKSGHCVQEDEPEKLAGVIAQYLVKQRLAREKGGKKTRAAFAATC